MTKTTTMGSLRELQTLDRRIRELEEAIREFDPQLAEVEEPALRLEDELGKASERLEQMKADTRRLERSAEDKRDRAKRLDERLNQVTNLREQSAVQTELDMVERAIEADEQEALQLLEQTRRNELHVDELRENARETRAQVEPRQEQMLQRREELREQIAELSVRRDAILEMLGTRERQVYESFHASGRSVVVAPLTEDGVCGNCFGLVPLQQQNEIRRGDALHRCEGCGVILTDEPEPEPEDEVSEGVADATEVAVDMDESGADESPEASGDS